MGRKQVRVIVCGPVPGGRGYFDFCEHAEQKRKRKPCDPGCFFCEAAGHPERYECVNGQWVDKVGQVVPPGIPGANPKRLAELKAMPRCLVCKALLKVCGGKHDAALDALGTEGQ